jgi:hypothetical protein
MKDRLAEYEAASVASWTVRDAESKAKAEMDRLCAKERRALRCKVKRIMREARPGWSLVYDGHDCHASINHIRPMKASVSVSVRLLYCAGQRRGEVRLYGDFDEMDAMLDELRKIVTANAPGELPGANNK